MTDKKPNHTCNRLFKEYTILREFSVEEGGIIMRSFIEAAEKLGKNERDDLEDLLRQYIALWPSVLIPARLLERHAAHLGHRAENSGYLFSEANRAAMRLINGIDPVTLTGPEAFDAVVAYWQQRQSTETESGGDV